MRITTGIKMILAFLVLGISCQPKDQGVINLGADDLVNELQRSLITATEGQTIHLPEGTFEFQRSLSLNDTPGISIIGKGKGKTVLSFKGQLEGAEGILVKNVTGLTLEGFTVSDSKGDAIKVQECRDVIMRDLETTWTTGKQSTNGAYGLYPVSSTNVLMEKCEASFAMDAGIYVGQSTNVVVRDNYVHNNVAGLEIENTINGEVYRNTARNNAGGMLIFDMPDLPQINGDRIKFYENVIEDNNGENFAPEGMVVSTIPPGSGMILMAHSNIEMHHNIIRNHKTLGVAVNSWLFTRTPYESEEYDPYCTNIYIHDNEITGTQGPTDATTEFGMLMTQGFGGQAFDLIIDGIFKPSTLDEDGNPTGFCFVNNGDISFLNLNVGMSESFDDIGKHVDSDLEKFNCTLSEFDTEDHDDWLTSN